MRASALSRPPARATPNLVGSLVSRLSVDILLYRARAGSPRMLDGVRAGKIATGTSACVKGHSAEGLWELAKDSGVPSMMSCCGLVMNVVHLTKAPERFLALSLTTSGPELS